jgi:CBS domain containing-hemolysin-like protein
MSGQALILAILAICLIVSFILSGMEAGVFALSRLRIRQQLRAGNSSARLLQGYLDNSENFLWTILVGNTVSNLLIFAWLVTALHDIFRGRIAWFILVYTLAVFLFYAFFDLLPKILFRTYPNRLCLLMAAPFRVVHFLLRPFVALVESTSNAILQWWGGKTFTGKLFGSRDELKQVMQETAQGLTSDERVMIGRVLELQSMTVENAMTSLDKVIGVDAEAPASTALEVGRASHHTRMPVWEVQGGARRVTGLIDLDDLLFGSSTLENKKVREFLHPATFSPGDLRLELGLRRMQRSGERLAVVLGRDQREMGIISLQDMLKVIFGEVNL